MSRRHRNEELEFGSDSFLDIIANIVGILIILIVIAGVKVARQPPEAPVEAVVPVPVVQSPKKQRDPRIHQEQLTALNAEAMRLRTEIRQIDEQTDLHRQSASKWSTQAEQISDALSELRSVQADDRRNVDDSRHLLASVEAETSGVSAGIIRLTKELEDAEQKQSQSSRALDNAKQHQAEADEELKDIEYESMRLQEVLDGLPVPDVQEADRLTHRLSPVAGSTSDEEIHFRLSDGRIAWVPLKPLLEQLKDQVRSRASVINRFGRYEGVVGPTGGFLMKYTVARQAESPLQSLGGRRAFKVGVSRWVVKPSDTLTAEPAASALQIGSQFRQVLEAADPGTTVTIWLYANDFEAFRPLREYAHSLGLRVAARPLPDDADITGSPAGSKSSAQ